MAEHLNQNATHPEPITHAINLDNFQKRLKRFYSHWKEHKTEFWGASDALAIAIPPFLDRGISVALSIWLLGCKFQETIMVFMEKQIHFLCTQEKASLLETLKESAREAASVTIMIHVKANSNDGATLMNEIFHIVRSQSKYNAHNCPVVGYIAREAPEGKLLKTWAQKLKTEFQLNDITNGFSELFSVKDDTELMNVKKAADFNSFVMTYFIFPKLKKAAYEGMEVSHSSMVEETKAAMFKLAGVEAENIELCYAPIFQCGGLFELGPIASGDDEDICYDSMSVLTCAIGTSYNGYCSNLARTIVLSQNFDLGSAQAVLTKAKEGAMRALKAGNKVSSVYQAAVSVIMRHGPEFLPYLRKSVGVGIGLKFGESGWILNERNDRVLKAGMVFDVSLGFQNLAETDSPIADKFSLLVTDTVIINEETTEVVTSVGGFDACPHYNCKAVEIQQSIGDLNYGSMKDCLDVMDVNYGESRYWQPLSKETAGYTIKFIEGSTRSLIWSDCDSSDHTDLDYVPSEDSEDEDDDSELEVDSDEDRDIDSEDGREEEMGKMEEASTADMEIDEVSVFEEDR